ncbi:MAG: VWA domain-containing protein [Acidobacteriota bacterium]
MKKEVRGLALAALLGSGLALVSAAAGQQESPVPNAPTPQHDQALPGAAGPIIPGSGTGLPAAPAASSSKPAQKAPPPPPPPPAPPKSGLDKVQTAPPQEGEAAASRFVVNVNFVEVPVTVKDTKGNPVAGLTWRNFQVYENNVRVPLSLFSVDPAPLSVAFVIDQTLPSNVMDTVNHSLGAIQGALTPYDEAAVFTYANGAKEWTGFTGAQGNRLPAVLSLAQAVGTDPQVPVNSGPFGGCAVVKNGNCTDPNVNYGGSTGNPYFIKLPKEIHTLNDAILRAAKELSTRPRERRRVIYVISDGKEYGSTASWKEVVKYLQTNQITVYATLVGDSARWGEGWIDRFHLPFQAYDNILYKYVAATGGDMQSEGSANGMEASYAKIAAEARNQYTLGYLSHESIYDGKYRSIDVRVDRPNLVVTAKPGYYPSAQDYK